MAQVKAILLIHQNPTRLASQHSIEAWQAKYLGTLVFTLPRVIKIELNHTAHISFRLIMCYETVGHYLIKSHIFEIPLLRYNKEIHYINKRLC